MDRIKSQLSKEFEMKDLELLKYYMVIEVARSSLGIKSLKGNTRPAKKLERWEANQQKHRWLQMLSLR